MKSFNGLLLYSKVITIYYTRTNHKKLSAIDFEFKINFDTIFIVYISFYDCFVTIIKGYLLFSRLKVRYKYIIKNNGRCFFGEFLALP